MKECQQCGYAFTELYRNDYTDGKEWCASCTLLSMHHVILKLRQEVALQATPTTPPTEPDVDMSAPHWVREPDTYQQFLRHNGFADNLSSQVVYSMHRTQWDENHRKLGYIMDVYGHEMDSPLLPVEVKDRVTVYRDAIARIESKLGMRDE